MSRFIPFDRSQPYLLLPDLKSWLPVDDMAHFIVAAVERVPMVEDVLPSHPVGFRLELLLGLDRQRLAFVASLVPVDHASTTVAVRFADRTDEEFGIYLGVQRLKFEYSGKHKNHEQLKNKLKCNCSASCQVVRRHWDDVAWAIPRYASLFSSVCRETE
ncbi:hypothetical protein [Acetobacter aceti]|uniref:hypothetical protein n=1 Tax=Acetobacter aceti TaxID=435 RepID=UPI001629FD48|nr:hypothetical protein [Acetobacter aceti]